MELKTKYQYTYFIYPYIVEEKNYEKYLYKLLMDQNYTMKIFEKEKDFDLYEYFLPVIRSTMFWSIDYDSTRMKKLAQIDKKMPKVAEVEKKYEDAFSLYLESIDKHMMDNVYKKVKNDTATIFEKEALSKYYMVIHLKDIEYLEYKYRKQIFLIQLDYDTVKELNKEKLLQKYEPFYGARMEALYKKLLKNYSVKLSENITNQAKNAIYNKIFSTVEEYITDILPIKMKEDPENKVYKDILNDYKNFERFTVGKLDQNDVIEKNMILLGISRKLFTHSLPLVIAEQCYEKLLVDARTLIMDTKIVRKQEKAYGLLINIIDDYNLRLLSTKIYWDKPQEREEYKIFYAKYKKINELKEKDYLEYSKQKEILFLREELKKVYKNIDRYCRIEKFYKRKLVALGAMRELKNGFAKENRNFVANKSIRSKEIVSTYSEVV